MSERPRLSDSIRTFPEALALWAERTPDAIAMLASGREPATYRELHRAVDRLAAGLRALGVGRHDWVVLLLPEGPDLSLAMLAASAAGIAVPLAWPNPAPETERVVASPRVRAVVVSEANGASVRELGDPEVPVVTLSGGTSGRLEDVHFAGQRRPEAAPPAAPLPDDVALVLHSSGTVGRPKLVPRLHRGVVSMALAIIDATALTPADRCLSLARTAYAQGASLLTTTVFAGASLVATSRPDFEELAGVLNAHRPTYLTTSPAMLRMFADDRGSLRDALAQTSLRCIHTTSGALATDETERVELALGVRILNRYGMSEAAFIAGETSRDERRVPGSVGLPKCELRTVDDHGEPLRAGEPGEFVVRGPRVFPGYIDDDAANAAAFLPDGWFRTGDLGFVDADGYVHLIGRLKELINRGGEKIVPREVEDVLGQHPAVKEAVVFAVADARLGEDIVAAVVLEPDAQAPARALRAWLLDRLAPYKAPRRIWFVDDFPRTATGKVQRGELARRWLEARG